MLPVNATGNQSRNSRIPLNALFLLTGSLTIFVFLMFIDVDLISTLKIGALFNNSAGLAYSSVRFALNLIVAFLAFGTFMGARMRAELREQADSGDEGNLPLRCPHTAVRLILSLVSSVTWTFELVA